MTPPIELSKIALISDIFNKYSSKTQKLLKRTISDIFPDLLKLFPSKLLGGEDFFN